VSFSAMDCSWFHQYAEVVREYWALLDHQRFTAFHANTIARQPGLDLGDVPHLAVSQAISDGLVVGGSHD
jgi:hypothetical protein